MKRQTLCSHTHTRPDGTTVVTWWTLDDDTAGRLAERMGPPAAQTVIPTPNRPTPTPRRAQPATPKPRPRSN